MKFGRYLTLMASTWVLAALAVAAFTLLVDAIGISPVRVAIAGFNAWKPLRQNYDWIVKRYDVRLDQPATIFMGSSRVKQSIDPILIAKTGFAPGYNGGINGSSAYEETKSYLQYYLSVDKNLQNVFIEAFATALLTHREPRLPPPAAPGRKAVAQPEAEPPPATAPQTRPQKIEFGVMADIADFGSVFFSASGVSSAVRTVWANRGLANSPSVSWSDGGFAPIALAPHHFSVRNVFNFVLHTGLLQRGAKVPPSVMAEARQMIANCEWHQVECQFFLSPIHADVLFAMFYLGLWPELEKLKREFAKLAPTYDFTRYSHIIDERTGPVVYWPEAFHFSPALGELVARAMTGLRTPDMPGNFGVILEPKNIDASLAVWREERDSWIAQHPDLVERMRNAEQNFHKGVSFKATTDAEIAAGGW